MAVATAFFRGCQDKFGWSDRAFVPPALVDASGYTLLLRQAQGNGKVKRERYAQLPLNSATVSDVGDQL
jgi:hypothetical protein